MTRIPRQKRALATVDAIVEAGFLAVAEHGEAGATTNHIAEIAGISVGSLYEYFRNKEAIYTAMQERMVNDAVTMIQPLVNEVVQLDVRDAVKTLLHHFETFLRDNDGRYLKYAQHSLNVSVKLHVEPLIRLLQELVMRYAMQH
ncbi:MAG: TetR/AcrR family transcriptional regulator, partial [Moraxellaceae bacterium]|nr:TetR/AcrR family transcriptional regulator [Moraxellaceae bacterium]